MAEVRDVKDGLSDLEWVQDCLKRISELKRRDEEDWGLADALLDEMLALRPELHLQGTA